MNLEIITKMSKLGYKLFKSKNDFITSSISYNISSLQNKESDPVIYNIYDEADMKYRYWSHTKFLKTHHLFEELVSIEKNIFINNDNFLSSSINDENEIFLCKHKNSFSRPQINGIDERLDLGHLFFAVSNAGVLFSFYEYLKNKVTTEYDDSFEIKYNPKYFEYRLQTTTIGTLGDTFKIQTVHVFPKNNIWDANKYEDFV